MPASAKEEVSPLVFECGDYCLDLGKRTHVMGILNLTPDSFSDGSRFSKPEEALSWALEMVRDGADIVDIGAESSRPGARPVSAAEELRRIKPVLSLLLRELSVPVSVDTYKYEVAKAALDMGAQVINDISGLSHSPRIASLAVGYNAGLVLMHMQGTPQDMQLAPAYGDVMGEIGGFLRARADYAVREGVAPRRIVIDPGIGFGKTLEHNLEIIRRLGELRELGFPVLLGTSRKSFIGKVLELPVSEREEGTAATVTYGILQGASIVRVHDVKAMARVARMTDAVRGAG